MAVYNVSLGEGRMSLMRLWCRSFTKAALIFVIPDVVSLTSTIYNYASVVLKAIYYLSLFITKGECNHGLEEVHWILTVQSTYRTWIPQSPSGTTRVKLSVHCGSSTYCRSRFLFPDWSSDSPSSRPD